MNQRAVFHGEPIQPINNRTKSYAQNNPGRKSARRRADREQRTAEWRAARHGLRHVSSRMKKSITRFAFCAVLLIADFARLIAADLVLSAGSGVRVINTRFDGAGENRRWR